MSAAVPMPVWAPFMSAANYPQFEPYNATAAYHYGRYIVFYPNGSLFISAGMGSVINLDGIILMPITGF